MDSKTHDLITMDMKSLYGRMIIARYDKQLTSVKQLQTTIGLLEQSLNQRSVSFILRRRLSNPNEVCFVCCSTQRTDAIDRDLEEEHFTTDDEESKELILQEGQLLELRFRGNVLPTDDQQKSHPFAFNTYFPFYFQTNVSEIDKYSQHFSSYYYGFVQIFSKQKVLRTINKDMEKKKHQTQPDIVSFSRTFFDRMTNKETFSFLKVKQEWHETDVCLAELVIRLPKPREQTRTPPPKTLPTFTSEGKWTFLMGIFVYSSSFLGVLTPALFRDISERLNGDEWRWLARRLGITRIRIEAIERDYHEDAPYHMLFAWFKRVPRSADKVLLLINALRGINRLDLVQALQSMKDEKRQELRTFSNDGKMSSF